MDQCETSVRVVVDGLTRPAPPVGWVGSFFSWVVSFRLLGQIFLLGRILGKKNYAKYSLLSKKYGSYIPVVLVESCFFDESVELVGWPMIRRSQDVSLFCFALVMFRTSPVVP